MSADFSERADCADASRGRVDAGDPVTIRAADGSVVFDLERYSYLGGDCPDTVNPSLWRLATESKPLGGDGRLGPGTHEAADNPETLRSWAARLSRVPWRKLLRSLLGMSGTDLDARGRPTFGAVAVHAFGGIAFLVVVPWTLRGFTGLWCHIAGTA